MQRFAYPRVAARLFGRPLAIDPPRLKAIMDALGERIVIGAFDDDDGEALPSRADIMARRLGAIAGGKMVQVADGMGEYCLTPGGVAVIPVVGPLAQRFDWLAAVCGFATYEGLGATLDAVVQDGAVRAILFDGDTPGGEAMGMFDLADKVMAARAVKPVWACANGLAASAGYGVLGSAGRLTLPRMGYVGSIGMLAIHVDRSGEDEQRGLKYSAIYSGKRKIDGWDHAPLTKDARTRLQEDIDDGRRMFADLVARQGRIDQKAALDTEADLFRDAEAVDLGLADYVMSFDDTLAELEEVAAGRPANAAVRYAARKTGEPDMTKKATAGEDPAVNEDKQPAPPPADTKSEGAPAPAEPAKDQATAAAAQAEASRTKTIVELCALAGLPAMALGFINAKASVDDVRAKLAKAKADAVDRNPVDGTPPQSSAPVIDVAALYAQRNAARG
ncbi:S49 family peptidase [Vineibacter terrae]|uniref:S49 family peptidase n=1 Tax=Vineibacter terrae TaxID=2586908 RepID=A0A5C8PH82_9HYPH|nr:S49 family peptidase [Vineibacter terrae]TXL72551.1 S49 family peptidase [Vineibacter terrae]